MTCPTVFQRGDRVVVQNVAKFGGPGYLHKTGTVKKANEDGTYQVLLDGWPSQIRFDATELRYEKVIA